jgi:hypothetical protein
MFRASQSRHKPTNSWLHMDNLSDCHTNSWLHVDSPLPNQHMVYLSTGTISNLLHMDNQLLNYNWWQTKVHHSHPSCTHMHQPHLQWQQCAGPHLQLPPVPVCTASLQPVPVCSACLPPVPVCTACPPTVPACSVCLLTSLTVSTSSPSSICPVNLHPTPLPVSTHRHRVCISYQHHLPLRVMSRGRLATIS